MYCLIMAIRPEDLPTDPARLIEMVLALDAENERLRVAIEHSEKWSSGNDRSGSRWLLPSSSRSSWLMLRATQRHRRQPTMISPPSSQPVRSGSPVRRPSATSARCQNICHAANRYRAGDNRVSVLPGPVAQDRRGRQRGARRHSGDPAGSPH